jgi:hypothetical protein
MWVGTGCGGLSQVSAIMSAPVQDALGGIVPLAEAVGARPVANAAAATASNPASQWLMHRDPEYVDASPCPTANLPQIRLEPVLKTHAEKLNPGGVRFHHELVGLEQDPSGVRRGDISVARA